MTTWKQGEDINLAGLIQRIQAPPMTRVGVLDLESFYPSKERFELAMQMNNLLASPGFQLWLEGRELDINRLLHDQGGQTSGFYLLYCTLERCRTNVFRFVAA